MPSRMLAHSYSSQTLSIPHLSITASPQHQPPQHPPQRLRPTPSLLAQPPLNPAHQSLRLSPQFTNHSRTILETPLTLHIPERISFDLLIARLLLQDIDEDLVTGIGADGVDDGEREFSFGEVFAEAFERGVAGCGGEVEVVVEDLEEETDCGDEGGAVTTTFTLVTIRDIEGVKEVRDEGVWRDIHIHSTLSLHELDS